MQPLHTTLAGIVFFFLNAVVAVVIFSSNLRNITLSDNINLHRSPPIDENVTAVDSPFNPFQGGRVL